MTIIIALIYRGKSLQIIYHRWSHDYKNGFVRTGDQANLSACLFVLFLFVLKLVVGEKRGRKTAQSVERKENYMHSSCFDREVQLGNDEHVCYFMYKL